MLERIEQMKVRFRTSSPDDARVLEAAKSQEDLERTYELLLQRARERLAKALGKKPEELNDSDQSPVIALKEDLYNNLINARGDDIEAQLHVVLDGLQRLKGMDQDDAYLVAAQVLMMGALAIGSGAVAATQSALLGGYTVAAAVYFGVQTATVEIVCALAALLVLLIVVPIIYYMKKPALCLVLVINEMDNQIDWVEDYNVHGKPTLHFPSLPGGTIIPGYTVVKAGFVATQKKDNALQGTQYGFTYQLGGTNLVYGVTCPLVIGDNAGYCQIGGDAQQVAEQVDSQGSLYSEAKRGPLTTSIRCNSGSGSVAYYVARAFQND